MSQIMAWNCQGLGRTLTIQKLGDLVRSHAPSVVFLSETKQFKYRVNALRRRLKFSKGETVEPSLTTAGGLANTYRTRTQYNTTNYAWTREFNFGYGMDTRVSVEDTPKWVGHGVNIVFY